MLTHSEDYMLSQDVRLSVHLFVTRRYFVEMANTSSNFFSPSGSHIILVFRTKRYVNIQTATLP